MKFGRPSAAASKRRATKWAGLRLTDFTLVVRLRVRYQESSCRAALWLARRLMTHLGRSLAVNTNWLASARPPQYARSQKLPKTAVDETERQLIQYLLAEERAKSAVRASEPNKEKAEGASGRT